MAEYAELTVKEYAQLERVDQRTVRRWIEKGAITVRRTPGGHIRIPRRQSGGVVLISLGNAQEA